VTISLLIRNAHLIRAHQIVAGRREPFTIAEAAETLGIARWTLNRWKREGRIHFDSVIGNPTPQPCVEAAEMRRLLGVPEPDDAGPVKAPPASAARDGLKHRRERRAERAGA
jgi:hypothetical protein